MKKMKLLKSYSILVNQFLNNGNIENKDILSSVDQFMINEKVKNSNITDIIKTPKNLLFQDLKNKKDMLEL